MRKERKNEALLWFGKWTSKLGNIVFDYANSVSIVGAFSHAPWVLALYQSSETVIQIVFNLIGGAKADSGSRKKILIVTDVFSAAICLAVSFFVASPRMAEVVIAANALLAVVTPSTLRRTAPSSVRWSTVNASACIIPSATAGERS